MLYAAVAVAHRSGQSSSSRRSSTSLFASPNSAAYLCRRLVWVLVQAGLSVAERRLRGRNAGRRLRLGMAQGGLSITQRRLCGGDAGRRLRLGIRQVRLVIVQRCL